MSLIHVRQIQDANDSTTISINSASTTYYSKSFSVQRGNNFALAIKSNIAEPSITISLEQSWVEPNEGNSDGNWVVPTGVSAIFTNLNNSITNIISVSPVSMPYARLKFASAAATTSTQITGYFAMVENI